MDVAFYISYSQGERLKEKNEKKKGFKAVFCLTVDLNADACRMSIG